MADVPFWQAGTLYQPGDLVRPTNSGAVSQPAITNPSFEDGDVGWTVTFGPGSWTIDEVGEAFDGTWAGRAGITSNPDDQTMLVENDARPATTPGALVTFRPFIFGYSNGSVSNWSGVKLRILWFNAADDPLSPSESIEFVFGSHFNAVWRPFELSAVAPAGAAKFTVGFRFLWGNSGFYIDQNTLSFANVEAPNPLLFRAVQAAAGFSGNSEPDWPETIGLQVLDNEVTWEAVSGNSVTWQASRILVSGAVEPVWPLVVNGSVPDNTIAWTLDSRRVTDSRVPNDSSVVLLASSKVFVGDDDIINFSATVNPLDWSTPNDAGYIGFGLQQYGNNPITAMGLYRGNLAAFNSQGCQLWQLDEDPAGIAYLDAIPVACTYPKTVQPVGDDLGFLSNLGIRSLGLSGAAVNLQGGYFGQQIDPLVLDRLRAAVVSGIEPMSLYWPARGQAWWFFGAEAFVLTINAGSDEKPKRSWSRYVFPAVITDWTIQGIDLVLRSGNLVWIVDPEVHLDDAHDVASTFQVDLELAVLYETTAGWGVGVTSIELEAVHNFVNGTRVQLFGPSLTGLFADTTVVTGAEDATVVVLSQAVTAATGDLAIFRYPAEVLELAGDDVIGERELRLTGDGVQTYLRAGTVVRITWASGVDWNYLRNDVDVNELDLPLENPLEHEATEVRLYPEGATIVNGLTADVMYVPIALAAPAVASTSITLARGLPAIATAAALATLGQAPIQMIACQTQVTTVNGGQATDDLVITAATTFGHTGGGGLTYAPYLASPSNWFVPAELVGGEIDILAIGGGGGGGYEQTLLGGGGGGGAVFEAIGVAVSIGDEIQISVGDGGPGAAGITAQAGFPSSVVNVTTVTTLLEAGGGGAGEQPFDRSNGLTGSSGGGGAANPGALTGPGLGDAPGNDGGAAFNANAGAGEGYFTGGGGGAGSAGTDAAQDVPGNGGAGLAVTGWGAYDGTYGGGGAGAGREEDAFVFVAFLQGTRGVGGGAPNTGGGGNAVSDLFETGGEDGFSGLVVLRYTLSGGGPPTAPEAGFGFVLVGALASIEEGEPFDGAIQWPFLDMKAAGADKELLGFDLVINGDADVTIGYNQRHPEYSSTNGWWTTPYEVNGDTLPDDMLPYSLTAPTFSLRLRFGPNQPWEWFQANLYIKDLDR